MPLDVIPTAGGLDVLAGYLVGTLASPALTTVAAVVFSMWAAGLVFRFALRLVSRG